MKAGGDYADRWEIVRLPAIAETSSDLNDWAEDPMGRKPGEALWPDPNWFPIPALERIRRNSAFPRYWYALFQQNPIPDEGDMFTVANLGKRDHTNDVILWYRGWGSTKKEGSPYSCGVKIGRTREGKYVVGHVVRARGKPDAIRELILETANFDGKRVRIWIPQAPPPAPCMRQTS
jgi:hypothetical protein